MQQPSRLISAPRSSSRWHCSSSRRLCRQRPGAAAAAAATQPHWRVYEGRVPLVGLEPLAAVLAGTPAQRALQLHTYVLLEGPGGEVWTFDFLPLRATSPTTAFALLTAGRTPGALGCGALTSVLRARPAMTRSRLLLLTPPAWPAGEVRARRLRVSRAAAGSSLRLAGSCDHDNPLALVHAYNRQGGHAASW